MDYLPVCLKLDGKPVLLVGGGIVATRKARLLARAGAVLHVLAPWISDELQELAKTSGTLNFEPWDNRSLCSYRAVVAATPDRAINAAISQRAQEDNIPVNVVDDPDLCSFIIPAIVDRNPLLVGISSSGASPVLARRLRSDIESRYPERYGDVARFLGERRSQVSDALATEDQRRHFWERVLDDTEFTSLLLRGDDSAATSVFEQALSQATINSNHRSNCGAVYLIGAGPGDPDLMTFKALRLLQRADVVLYDRLIGPGILEMARRDADKIYVGKQRADHAMPQTEINAFLLRTAKEGKRVARLKGGDPFIFGRGGEEIEGLLAAGVHFEVVPGITAASGAACYGGIPLTHRDYAQSVRFVTGHTKDHQLDLPWAEFQNPRETLVFYMGLAGVHIIAAQLVAHGRDPATPAALVERATLNDQRVLAGTLDNITNLIKDNAPKAPTLLIIGDVVRLHLELTWFDTSA